MATKGFTEPLKDTPPFSIGDSWRLVILGPTFVVIIDHVKDASRMLLQALSRDCSM